MIPVRYQLASFFPRRFASLQFTARFATMSRFATPSRSLPMIVSHLAVPLRAALALAGLLPFMYTHSASAAEPTKRPAWTKSRVHGAPEAPAPYRVAPAFAKLKFQKPTSVEELPGMNRLLVTEMGGKIYSFPKQADVTQADTVVDLRTLLPADLKEGNVALFDAEPHPKFAENHFVYVCYVHPGNGRHTRVSRLTLTAAQPPQVVAGSEQVVITWPAGGHNAGCLEFGQDGMLYVATGDGSGPNPPDGLTTGQDVSDLLGAILRIDVDRPSGDQAYTVPADNPFVSMVGAKPEIWSYGLRNPWKFGIDPRSGDIFVADNGWESWEMIHKVQRGGNCGWPVMEGRAALRSEVKVGPTPIIPPAMDHPHTEANSVIGGPVYRGSKLAPLDGSFVYGDYITGTIWGIRRDADGGYSPTTLVDTDLQIVAFLLGSAGELYVMDYDVTGQIYELLPSDVKDTSATFPRRLSETGLFESVKDLRPAPGVVPYAVRAERWMDGAQATRWVAIPGDETIKLGGGDQAAEYPEGTVFVKHLSLPTNGAKSAPPVETQLLHFESGSWRPYAFRWNEAGTDADLVDSVGATSPVRGAADRTWHFNAVNECKLCHNANAGFVLGFVPNQLRRQALAASGGGDQHLTLDSQGVIRHALAADPNDPGRLVDPHDSVNSLDDRARSYLHANCSMCHHPRGNAIVSFYLRRELPFDKLNTNKGTGIGTFGMPDAKIIAAGDPYRSVLMYRMSKLGYARMPYIGSRVVDGQGVALIESWIRSLSDDPASKSTGPAKADSAEARALATLAKTGTSQSDRTAALKTLVASTPGSLALIARLHGGGLAGDDFQAAVDLGGAASSDVRGLFETFIPESKRRPTLGPKFDLQVVLGKSGDAGRGKLIFHSDGARCRACHDVQDKKLSIGPTLQEINKKYPKPAEMLQHVVQPSLKIDEPFAAYVAVTDDGRALTGLIERQSEQEVVLRTADKRTVRLARSEIEELRKSDKSLMPDMVLSDLTAQEAADLFEYVRSLGAAP